jgi:hypothetical protein
MTSNYLYINNWLIKTLIINEFEDKTKTLQAKTYFRV